jgi:hypothetical protein
VERAKLDVSELAEAVYVNPGIWMLDVRSGQAGKGFVFLQAFFYFTGIVWDCILLTRTSVSELVMYDMVITTLIQ